jgi:cytochrome c5
MARITITRTLAAIVAVSGSLFLMAAPSVAEDGQEVYEETCAMCHEEGMAESPIFGDKDAWAPRIAKGMDILTQHAIEGFEGEDGMMPERGGDDDLSDDEIKAAVAYMVNAAK